jgi:hypothetical protein
VSAIRAGLDWVELGGLGQGKVAEVRAGRLKPG